MTIVKQRAIPVEIAAHLQQSGISPLMARLLAARGVTGLRDADTSLANLLPPDTLMNSRKMATLLLDAIRANQSLLVIGDYDADGATATAVAVQGLRAFGAHVDFLVPNRFEYGYGLTPEIVALASLQKPDIIITVDNGIASVDGVAAANALGIQVLVTDHHLPGNQTPQAACIVNPNQRGCEFASKNLAGVGVMFYVLLALRAEMRMQGDFAGIPEPNLSALLDLVALGTVADLVKLDQNNRILVEQGLRRIRAGACCPGLKALLQVAGRNPASANAQDLGFYVGPRLNAAGRLDDMTLGIRCLLAETEHEALGIARKLHELNIQRRSIESDMHESANVTLDETALAAQYTLSLYDPEWHQGVIGILASRIKERHHRPVIAFADGGDGLIKGSGRSIPGLHLRDALDLVSKQQPNLILKFGGHAMAAGLTMKASDFAAFKASFEEVVRSLITEADLEAVIEVDGGLDQEEMSFQTAQLLERHVWGQGFAPPLFFDAFTVLNQGLLADKHLKLLLRPSSGNAVEAVWFNRTDFVAQQIQAVYQLQTNTYNGMQKVQIHLRHVV